jgi:hypothetical protein
VPYAIRNPSGKIINLQTSRSNHEQEWIDDDNPEVLAFLNTKNQNKQVKQALSISDNEMMRVVDDLIDLLIEKQVFVYTELPPAVQDKLHSRKQLRQNMRSLSDLVAEDDAIFPDF